MADRPSLGVVAVGVLTAAAVGAVLLNKAQKPRGASQSPQARHLADAAEHARRSPDIYPGAEAIFRQYAREVSAGRIDARAMRIRPRSAYSDSVIWLESIGAWPTWRR